MRRVFSKVFFSLVVSLVLLAGYSAHVGKNLNLSGDEVLFAAMGLRQWLPEDALPYARTLQKLDSIDAAALEESIRSNYAITKKYFTLHRLYYEEYVLPKVVWALTTKVVDSLERKKSTYDSAHFMGESVFWMLMAGLLAASIGFLLIASRLDFLGKSAVLVALVLLALRDTLPVGEILERSISTSMAWGVMLRSFASANKDFLVFGMSSRSLFLLLLVVTCVLRWRRSSAGSKSVADVAMLSVLSLIHATSGALVGLVLFAAELVTAYRARRFPDGIRVMLYATCFGLSARSGSFAEGWIYVVAYLGALAALGLGLALLRQQLSSRPVTGSLFLVDVVAFGAACLVYMVGSVVVHALHVDGNALFQYQLVGERFGAIAAVVLVTGLAYFSVRLVNDRLFPGGVGSHRESARPGLLPSAMCGILVLAGVAALAAKPFSVFPEARTRLYSHAKDFNAASQQAVDFKGSNALHLLWFGVVNSMLSDSDCTVTLLDAVPQQACQISAAPPPATGGVGSAAGEAPKSAAPRIVRGASLIKVDGRAACFITSVDSDPVEGELALAPGRVYQIEGWAADGDLNVPSRMEFILKGQSGEYFVYGARNVEDRSRAAEVFGRESLKHSGYLSQVEVGDVPAGTYEVLVRQHFDDLELDCPVSGKVVLVMDVAT